MADAVEVLEREMYSEAEAARLLGMSQATLHYWLEGRRVGRKHYRPVIRVEPRGGHEPITWAEFVEAALLRAYRRDHQVPMAELRAFIDDLRDNLGVPYPLAHRRPYVSGRQLVWDAQQRVGLDPEFSLVVFVSGQYLLTPASDSFLQRVVWDDDAGVARAWRPAADPGSAVIIDPEIRFGKPSVGGISTHIIWEHDYDGEGEQEIAEAFGVTVQDVRWALAYEMPRQSA